MNPERWQRVKDIFAEVADLHGTARDERLLSACGGDQDLLAELQRLLSLGEETATFLETPPTLPRLLRVAPEPGQVFQEGHLACGRFRIARLIGRGGMAEVYEAEDETMPGMRIALKTIRPGFGILGSMKEQFKRELELSRQVTHPNVCRVNEIYIHRWPDDPDEAWLLSMELLEGETLSARLRKAGRIGWREAWPLVNQMGQALEAAHRVGVVHRDFKSSNVMLIPASGGVLRAVVTDFGLAAAVGASSIGACDYPAGGTPGFMSPEQSRGELSTKASDIYSFGVVLYEMVSGQLPFPLDGPIGEATPGRASAVAPRTLAKDLPHYWQKTILRCLEWNPASRIESAREVVNALDPDKAARRRTFVIGSLGAVAAGGAWRVQREDIRRVAVLPFRIEPASPESEVLADGFADELIRILSGVTGLTLIARTSSFQFRGSRIDFKDAAKRLRADALLGGDFERRGSIVRVQAQLHGPGSGRLLWNAQFEKPATRVPELPIEIARSVTTRLGLSFSPPQAGAVRGFRTRNSEAFNWYILGRNQAQRRLEPALEQSLISFEKAIVIDPEFALAISEKAASHVMLSKFACDSSANHLKKAEDLAFRALQLAPDLAEAHLALGATWQKEWKWNPALNEFRKARDLNPNLSVAHHWLAGLLSNLGASEEALREIAIARDLDPLSVPVNNAFGGLLHQAGLYDQAVAQLELVLSMDRGNAIAHNLMAQACTFAGKQDRAFKAIAEAIRLEPNSPMHVLSLALIEGRAGYITSAQKRLQEIEGQRTTRNFPPYFVAQAYMGIGNHEKAFEWLELGLKCKDPSFAILKVDPAFAPVRGHEAFRDLIRRLEL